jgi:hypothetical protein
MIGDDILWSNIYLSANKIDPNSLSGSILYLGMGTCFIPRLQGSAVTTTHILEIDDEMIRYNENIIKSDWLVIKGDAFIYEPSIKYDLIFIDIFYQKVNREVMESLIERYSDYLTPMGKIFYLHTVCRAVDRDKYNDVLLDLGF